MRFICILLPLLTGVALPERAHAQIPSDPGNNIWQRPILDGAAGAISFDAPGGESNSSNGHARRIPMFGMVTGFVSEPLGLDSHDDPPGVGPGDSLGVTTDTGEKGPVVVAMGLDNPNFDFQGKTAFGGVGFYKLHSQVQVLDEGTTCVSVGLQAVTPAGIEAGGLQGGPTLLRPNLAWFQELGEGTALHGFVSETIRAHAHWAGELGSSINYGMAVHYELPALGMCPLHSFQLFMEALGSYRLFGYSALVRPISWDFIPGVRWQMGESWWLAIGASRRSVVTCSWQF
jgi:hypothetical protein